MSEGQLIWKENVVGIAKVWSALQTHDKYFQSLPSTHVEIEPPVHQEEARHPSGSGKYLGGTEKKNQIGTMNPLKPGGRGSPNTHKS